jgi:CSLREA domain-containing protein
MSVQTSDRHRPWLSVCSVVGLVAVGLVTFVAAPVGAASVIAVTTTVDETILNGACSLREAVLAANTDQTVDSCAAGSGADSIVVPAGTYMLSIAGTGEDGSRTGDLDLTGDVTISGSASVIDANGIDRVVEVLGGATVVFAGLTIRGGQFVPDGAQAEGGGIDNHGSLTIRNSIVTANSVELNIDLGPGAGAGIANDGQLTMFDSAVRDNHIGFGAPDGAGGGILNSGTMTATRTTISDNTSWTGGGGLFNTGSATLVDSTVSGNRTGCSFCSANGAGVFNGGTMRITNSTISDNASDGGDHSGGVFGGGLFSPGQASLRNVTVSNNSVSIRCLSVCNPEEDSGGGGIFAGGPVTESNAIIAGNTKIADDGFGTVVTSASNCAGSLTSQGYNLFGDLRQCTVVGDHTGNLVVGDAGLGALGAHGGTTLTRAPSPASPAVDHGSPATVGDRVGACAGHDQRGVARPRDADNDGVKRCDIGAVEIAPSPTPAGQTGIANGSFDTSGPAWLAPWILRTDDGATISQDAVTHHDGAFAVRIDAIVAQPGAPHRTQLREEHRKLQIGRTYTLAFWAKASVARLLQVKLQQSVSPFTSYATATVDLTTGWQQFAVRYTSTINDPDAFTGFNLAQADGTVWIDQIRLVDTTLVQNGSFEATGPAWFSPWIFRQDLSASVIQDNTNAKHGVSSAKVTVNTASTATHLVQIRQEGKSLVAGRTYVIAFWAKASAARSIGVKLQDATAPFASAYTKSVALTTAWQQVVLIYTATTSRPNAFIGFNLARTTGQIWIDDVSLAELP